MLIIAQLVIIVIKRTKILVIERAMLAQRLPGEHDRRANKCQELGRFRAY